MFTKPTKKEIEKLSQMSYKELFVLKGFESALKSLVFIVVFYIIMTLIFRVSTNPIMLSIFFIADASVNTFKYKWFYKKE